MSKPRYAASVDANQKEIVRRLNEIPGVECLVIGTPLDLLIGYRRFNFLVEIKIPGARPRKDQEKQRDFIRDWPGQARQADSFEEILQLITGAYRKQ